MEIYSRVANNEFEFCKFTCVHLTRFDWFKNNQLLSELTHAHYREPVPLNVHADRFSTKVLDSDVIIVITPFFMSFNSA